MAKFDFSDFDEQKSKYDFSDFDEPKKQKEQSTGEQFARTAIDTVLPVAGAIGGAAIATPGSVGLATIPAGALGYAGGKQAARILKHHIFGDPYEETEAVGLVKQTGADLLEGVATEAGGIVLGKGVQAAAPYVSKMAKPVGEKIMSAADSMAARAIGAERATVKKLGNEKVKEVGRYALDNDLLKPFSNTEDIVSANQSAKARGGAMMEDVYSKIDKANQSTFNPLDVAAKVDQQIGGFYRSPINRAETNQLENTLESMLVRGDKNISIKEAQALKEELGKVANRKNNINITDKERMAREAYSIVSKEIDVAVDAGAKNIGSDDLLAKLGGGKKLYSNSKAAEELLQNKLAREQGNKMMGITDWGVVGGGIPAAIISGGSSVVPTVGILGAKKYAEKYGAQQGALMLDKAGKAISKTTLKDVPAASKIASNVIVKDFIPKPELKGVDRWIAKGQQRVIETDASIDPEFLNQYQQSKNGKNDLIRASELDPKSNRMNEIINKIKSSDEYKQFLKQKEKQAQSKEPDQAKAQKPIKFPLTVKKDGFTAVVRNPAELEEAKSEGWS